MGYSVLYIAFGVVALWLLGEVLLQHRARLRWRVLAFVGFLCVAGGVVLGQIVLVVLGVAGFGTGQALVTLSHRRGFTTGWVLGGSPRPSRRRRCGSPCDDPEETAADPAEDASGARYAEEDDPYCTEYDTADAPEQDSTRIFAPVAAEELAGPYDPPVYSPTPLPDETGEYGIYTGRPFADQGAQDYGTGWQEEQPYPGAQPYDPLTADPVGSAFANGVPDPATAGYDQQSYQAYQSYDGYQDPRQPAEPSYDPYAAYPPQYDQAATGYPPPYSQDAYQQPQQPYPYNPQEGGWTAAPSADPYGEPQPYVPQQAQPGYDPSRPEEPYEQQYPQYESYQPYGY